MNIENLKKKINSKVSEKSFIEKNIKKSKKKIKEIDKETEYAKEAREFLKEVAASTQNELKDFIEDIASTSVQHVYEDDNLSVKVDFTPKRNKTECDIYFDLDGHKLDPIYGCGHGVADMCSFGLRLAYCSLKETDRILVLDEPIRHVWPSSLRKKAVDLMKDLAKELNFQLIVVSNLKEFTENADKHFFVENGEITINNE